MSDSVPLAPELENLVKNLLGITYLLGWIAVAFFVAIYAMWAGSQWRKGDGFQIGKGGLVLVFCMIVLVAPMAIIETVVG